MIRLLLLSFLLAKSVLFALDVSYSQTTLNNGESLYIEIKKEPGQHFSSLSFNHQTVPLYTHPQKEDYVYALIPIGYYTDPGSYKIILALTKKEKSIEKVLRSIKVRKGPYKKEELRVDPSRIHLSKSNQARANREYLEAKKIYSQRLVSLLFNKPFLAPIKSVITSGFGNERLFNGVRKSYHSGVDYRAKVATPIFSVNSGKVVLAKKRFYAGGSVIISHGRGIFSCYYHASKILVHKGAYVKASQKLALSGATGRVNGPHLHFSMKLFGVTVNPTQLTGLIKRYLF